MRIFVALKIIACLNTLLLRCRLRVWLLKNLGPKNLDPRNWSRPMISLLLYPAPMRLSSLIARKKRKSIRRKNKIENFFFRLPETMPLKVMIRRKKAMESAIIAWKKAILLETAWKLQKTSIALGNLYAGNW